MVNTTWKHCIDLGGGNSDHLQIEGADGELDIYLFSGKPYGELLERSTDVVGKPVMLPIWAYGLTFLTNENSNAREVIDDALKFRQMKIPCDTIGLSAWTEPKNDRSVHKKWNPEKFRVSEDNKKAVFSFAGMLQKNGFKLNVLLGCDYDLSAYEERLLSGQDDTETDVGERWYDHLQKFVDDGVQSFKLTGNQQIFEHPTRAWANGMSDAEMHNLYPALLSKQMYRGYLQQTGKRPMIFSSTGYMGFQQFAAVYITGFGSQRVEAVSAMLNHGLAGQVHPTCDMNVNSAEGIHFGFLLPWAQINSWAYFRHPSYLEDSLQKLFVTYAKLHYMLIPYLYSAAHHAARTGMPIMRAMPLLFPDDAECARLRNQYMLGDSLLVAAFTDQVYLPEGVWIDYWTGERYKGPRPFSYAIPDGAGGPLFIRAGAIIPMWPPMDYIGQIELECIKLHIYPHDASEYTMYEDDGETVQYKAGQIAVTRMSCHADRDKIAVRLYRRQGSYTNMPRKRSYDLFIHTDRKPAEINCDGICAPERSDSTGWHYEETSGTVRFHVEEAAGNEPCKLIELTLSDADRFTRNDLPGTVATQAAESAAEPALSLPEALKTADYGIITHALRAWWESGLAGTAQSESRWRVHLMNGCILMIQHAERCGWAIEDVFGPSLEAAVRQLDISTPEQGCLLLHRFAQHILNFANSSVNSAGHPLIRKVIHIVEWEFDKKLSLNEIAARLFVNPSYLSRLFSKEMGQKFSDYVLDLRMKKAKVLLESGLRNYEVAAMTGYPDAAYFSRSFRKYWEASPTQIKISKSQNH
ncbi:MAG: xylS [Paenibacillus sp.]|nr:xylS [Paenibacillus sp.]